MLSYKKIPFCIKKYNWLYSREKLCWLWGKREVITNNCVWSQWDWLDLKANACYSLDLTVAWQWEKEKKVTGGFFHRCEVGNAHPTSEMENKQISLLGNVTITLAFFSWETTHSQDILGFRRYDYCRLCPNPLWISHVCLQKQRITQLWMFLFCIVCSS